MTLLNFTQILPSIIAILGFIASGIHLSVGNYGSALYWLSACTITIGIILIPKFG